MTPLHPTPEQSHILERASASTDNLMLTALAGCGKTTMLEMIEREVDTKPILYLVFSVKNKEEAEKKMLSTTTVRNFNGLGHRVWASSCSRNLSLDKQKSQTILREIIAKVPKRDQGPLWDVLWDVTNAVGLAKALGYIPEGVYPNAKRLVTQAQFHAALEEPPDDLVSDLIDAVLTRSIKMAYDGVIDFNDQIYMPALFGGRFPQFPLIMVDEYQDLNPTNHALIDRLCKHRIIGVGDPNQNIYGFRGAKAAGISEAQAKFNMSTLPLSISFRCPKAIVQHVHWRVPQFRWLKEGGSVKTLSELSADQISPSATFISRNNAPLFKAALHLLAHKHSVSVAGSDIGPKLLAMMKKIGSDSMSRASFLSAITDWQEEKLAKGSTTAQDLGDCMRVFAGFGETQAQAIAYAEHLFAQKGSIRLLTGHKAKGFEFDNVYHLDPYLCSDTEQDKNLRYVISTRSRDRLTEVNSRDIRW